MSYSSDEIQAAIQKASPQASRFERPNGALRSEAEFDLVRSTLGDALLLDSDGVLYLLRLLKERLLFQKQEATQAAQVLQTLLGEVISDAPAPNVDTAGLTSLRGHLRALRAESGATAQSRRVSLFAKGAKTVVSGLKVTRGGTVIRRPEEALPLGRASLKTLLEALGEISRLQAQVDQVLPEYVALSLKNTSLSAQTFRGEEILDVAEARLSQNPKAEARGVSLELLTLSGLLKSRLASRDPLADKHVGTLTPVVVGGKALQLTFPTGVLGRLRPAVRVGDRLVFGGQNYAVARVQTNSLWVQTPLQSLVAGTGRVLPLGAVGYAALLTGLATLEAPDIQKLSAKALAALSAKEGPGIALGLLGELLSFLFSLESTLGTYTAVTVPAIQQALTALRERRLDRAMDLLTGGELEAFFTITSEGASYKTQAMGAVASAGEDFPPPEDVPADAVDVDPNGPITYQGVTSEPDEPLAAPSYPVDDDDEEVSY